MQWASFLQSYGYDNIVYESLPIHKTFPLPPTSAQTTSFASQSLDNECGRTSSWPGTEKEVCINKAKRGRFTANPSLPYFLRRFTTSLSRNSRSIVSTLDSPSINEYLASPS